MPSPPPVGRLLVPRHMPWQLPTRVVPLDRPFILGIVNVTPDSFSDGGLYFGPQAAVDQAERLLDQGADGVDIGGESTRPHNAGGVDEEEEFRRVVPVIAELCQRRPEAVVTVDTVKSAVARGAFEAGADAVNDVSAFRLDPAMPGVVAAARAGAILMHSRGGVADMASYDHARYDAEPADAVVAELVPALDAARRAGIPPAAIVVDPGLGFAKRSEHSLAVLRALPRLAALGHPVLVGASRKRFVGELSGVAEPAGRLHGSIGAHVAALARGARLFRVHDVRPHREALDVAWAVLGEAAAGG